VPSYRNSQVGYLTDQLIACLLLHVTVLILVNHGFSYFIMCLQDVSVIIYKKRIHKLHVNNLNPCFLDYYSSFFMEKCDMKSILPFDTQAARQ
jgi:hypothetical protein